MSVLYFPNLWYHSSDITKSESCDLPHCVSRSVLTASFHVPQRIWRKLWTILFKPSSTGVGRLELCTLTDNNAVTDLKGTRLKVIRLSDCLSVTSAPEESCPPGCTAFNIKTMQSIYTLASTSSQAWQNALCLLAFQVHVSPLNFAFFRPYQEYCSVTLKVILQQQIDST